MSWRDNLVPAAFRGVPFEVDGHRYASGRRVALHEFPLRDTPTTDDLGRKIKRYTVRAYIIATPPTFDYLDQADALVSACQDSDQPGLLDHPWFGTGIFVRCTDVSRGEEAEYGGMAVFDLAFVEAGGSPSPTVMADTSAQIASSTGGMFSLLAQTLAVADEIAAAPGILLGGAEALLGQAAGLLAGVVGGVYGIVATTLAPFGQAAVAVALAVSAAQAAVAAIVPALAAGTAPVTGATTGVTGDPVAVAVVEAFALAAAAVLAVQTAPPDVQNAISGQLVTAQRLAADPTLGLAAIAGFGVTLTPPAGLRADLQAQLQADLVSLVTGAATITVAQIFAATDFVSSQAAENARETLLALIQAQVLAAAAAQNDAAYQGWLALTGQVSQDLLQRVLQLPALGTYSVTSTIPACVLAQRLYQDGTRGIELAVLNDIPHPGFLYPTGVALSS